MSNPFLGEIRMMSFSFAPRGWALCNGQTLPINQNQALFSLLGTTYGGNGTTTFLLPNLQSRVPIHIGSGFFLGQTGGEVAHTLTQSELPQHNHFVAASTDSNVNNTTSAPNNFYGVPNDNSEVYFTGVPDSAMAATLGNTGGNQPHENRQPYLGLNFCIALQGIFPSQN